MHNFPRVVNTREETDAVKHAYTLNKLRMSSIKIIEIIICIKIIFQFFNI